MPAIARKQKHQVTTVRLPSSLYEEARRLVNTDETEESSFNEFVVEALRRRVYVLREQMIDAQFCAMHRDRKLQEENEKIADEFAVSDWETLNAADGENR